MRTRSAGRVTSASGATAPLRRLPRGGSTACPRPRSWLQAPPTRSPFRRSTLDRAIEGPPRGRGLVHRRAAATSDGPVELTPRASFTAGALRQLRWLRALTTQEPQASVTRIMARRIAVR